MKEYYNCEEVVENAECCNCGKEHTWDIDSCALYNKRFVCEDCYDNLFGYCNECGELYKYSEMNDDIVCEGCEVIVKSI